MPMLAGISVTDDDTQILAEFLRRAEFPDVADKLERSLALGTRVFALTVTDRESILRALDEAPERRARRASCRGPARARVAGARGARLAARVETEPGLLAALLEDAIAPTPFASDESIT